MDSNIIDAISQGMARGLGKLLGEKGIPLLNKAGQEITEGDIQAIGKRAISLAYANANALAYAYANALANALAYAKRIINNFSDYAQWSQKFTIYQDIDFKQIISVLEQFKSEIPDKNCPEKEKIEQYQSWAKKLINFWLTSFHLTSEMIDLSGQEIKTLDKYFYGNLLMVDCNKAANRCSTKIWQEIESRMLLYQNTNVETQNTNVKTNNNLFNYIKKILTK